jgi:hypothetical protein
MLDREYWEFRQDWLEYVRRVWQGRGRVEEIRDELPERLSFQARARKAFEARNIPCGQVKTWVNVQVPVDTDGYAPGYPHTHEPKNAMTLVHYLYPGDKPAPLDVFQGETVIETIYPEVGLTVFMPNSLLHGVRNNRGKENRIAMIATALAR